MFAKVISNQLMIMGAIVLGIGTILMASNVYAGESTCSITCPPPSIGSVDCSILVPHNSVTCNSHVAPDGLSVSCHAIAYNEHGDVVEELDMTAPCWTRTEPIDDFQYGSNGGTSNP